VCNDSSCDLTGAQYCVECANASIPALLDTIEELRGLLEDARIVLYGTDEVGQYNMAQQIQEALK